MFTILVVDDVASSREPVALILRQNGYEVVRAATGRDALELLASDVIHLVLLDLVMPEMSGLEFLRTLRQDARYSGLPVIVLTGVGDADTVRDARKLGVQEYLVKGRYSIDRLLHHVQRQLNLEDAIDEDAAFENGFLGIA